jgi:hypothetical protein
MFRDGRMLFLQQRGKHRGSDRRDACDDLVDYDYNHGSGHQYDDREAYYHDISQQSVARRWNVSERHLLDIEAEPRVGVTGARRFAGVK